MGERVDFVKMSKDLPIDLKMLFIEVSNFQRWITLKNDITLLKGITQIVEARQRMDNAIIILKDIIMPEDNEYLVGKTEQYNHLLDNMGRFFKQIDKAIEDLEIRLTGEAKTVSSLLIKRIYILVREGMKHLVMMPIYNSEKMYFDPNLKTESGETIVKNKDLFAYFVFVHMLHSSEVLGALTREPSPTKTGMSTIMQRTHMPYLPDNVKTEEEQAEIVREEFTEPDVLSLSEDEY